MANTYSRYASVNPGGGLLVRPSPEPDEWLEGYAQRVIFRNGLICKGYSGSESELRATCSSLLGEQQQAVHTVFATRERGHYGSHLVPPSLLLGSPGRFPVCVDCMRESTHIRMVWRCAGVDTCPRHGQRLLGSCPGCGDRFGIATAVEGRCACGWSFDSVAELTMCSEPAREFADVVWGDLSRSVGAVPAEMLGAALFAGDLVPRLARRRRGRDFPFVGMAPSEYSARWLGEAGLRLGRGVDGITALLASLSEPIHLAFAAEYLQRMRRAEQAQETILSSLPLGQWQDVLASADAPSSRSRLMGLPAAIGRQGGLVTYKQVARSMAIPYEFVGDEVEAAGLTPTTMVRARRTYRFLTQEQLQVLRSTARLRPASISTRALGLDRTCSRQIQTSGVLRRIASNAHGLLRLDDWVQLDADLRASAVSGTPVKHSVRLSERRFWEWAHRDALRTVVDDVRRGRRRLFLDPRASGLSAYLVGPEVIWELRRLSLRQRSRFTHDGQRELFDRPESA